MRNSLFCRSAVVVLAQVLVLALTGCSSYTSVFYETEEPYAQIDFEKGGIYNCFVAVGEVSQDAFNALPAEKRRSYTIVGGFQWIPAPGEAYCRSGSPRYWFDTVQLDEDTFTIRGSADQEELVDNFTLLVASLLGLKQNFQYGSFSGTEESESVSRTPLSPPVTEVRRSGFIWPLLYGASYAVGKTVATYRHSETHTRTTYTREHVVKFFRAKPSESAFQLQQVVDSLLDSDSSKVIYWN